LLVLVGLAYYDIVTWRHESMVCMNCILKIPERGAGACIVECVPLHHVVRALALFASDVSFL